MLYILLLNTIAINHIYFEYTQVNTSIKTKNNDKYVFAVNILYVVKCIFSRMIFSSLSLCSDFVIYICLYRFCFPIIMYISIKSFNQFSIRNFINHKLN